MRNKYTPEFIEDLKKQAKIMNKHELIEWGKTKGYNISLNAMEKLLYRNNIKHKDYNSLYTHTGNGELPVGYEKIKNDGSGIVRIKTENGWKYKQRYLYEKHYGEIPKGYMVIFLDGDKTNFEIDNLFAVKTSDYLVARNKGLLSNDKEITKTALMYGELYHKTVKARKDNK